MASEGYSGVVKNSENWLGPFRFTIDFEGFKRLYHAENDRYLRKIGFWGLVFSTPFAGGSFLELIDHNRFGGPGTGGVADVLWPLAFIVLWLFFLLFLVRPPVVFATRFDEAVSFFADLGLRDVPDDPRGVSVSISVSLGIYGCEEVLADESVGRVPYELLRRPSVAHGFVFAGVRDRSRDSVLCNVWAGAASAAYRKAWNGSGVFVPCALLDHPWQVRWMLARKVRESRRRCRRAGWLSRSGRGGEARALLTDEVAWLAGSPGSAGSGHGGDISWISSEGDAPVLGGQPSGASSDKDLSGPAVPAVSSDDLLPVGAGVGRTNDGELVE
ncbi:hypothetical protein OZX62_07440 [Bifidobacterium sp. ESL0690]|uniref:hypothetical protein n=1 Tax=Bifidobacterium sp. ESL0690 TaxID=2983214 RepID=UPI0023F6367C|nr:hypothetical protein [Bifidobacterium sp. ESL0690]WEV46271.1 hypothetical protein OZX62_07440 [Bifidobacterium sp. ESL0690]